MKNIIKEIYMQSSLLKEWGIQHLQAFNKIDSSQSNEQENERTSFSQKKSIIKLPLQFTYPPVEIISKELTKLNSKYKERIIYLGPRWNDSFQWHKKFSKPILNQLPVQGYHFDQKRVQRNNSFIQDLMNNQNRFFKNELYYSVFEGMNPTIRDQIELVFQSRFQSGNLDCVVKTNENEYDLFLRIDANTRGNIFWYFFKVTLPKNCGIEKKKVKLNICNINKSKTLYERNLTPYVKRTKSNKIDSKLTDDWAQGTGITNCKIRQKRLRYPFIYEKVNTGRLYELSFQLQLNADEEVSLAYCIPYTYSYLISQLVSLQNQIKEREIPNIYIRKFGESLTGIQIPIIIVGDIRDTENNEQKKVVFITGRTHPGQSNGSLVVSSLIKQLCLKKTEEVFENRAIFVIIPMINPDGVILGNGRSSALGRDLNREFKSSNAFLNPQVVGIKRLIEKIQESYEIQFYFDFHGHSKKKNIFFFGPDYSLTEPNYYRCRVFPKILSKNLDFFRYFGCSYSISQNKRATARAVMLYDFKIPFFYTVETSIGFYHDYTKREDAPFSKSTYFKIGLKFKESLKQYFDGLQEYQAFLKNKRKQKPPKTQTSLMLKIQNEKKNEKDLELRNASHEQKVFSLRLVKMFEEIKNQTKNHERVKNQQISQTDSDSCRASQELQTQKVKELSQMLVAFNRLEEKKDKPNYQSSFSMDSSLKKKRKKKFSKQHSQLEDNMFSFIRKIANQNQSDTPLHSRGSRFDFSKQPKSKQFHLLPKEFNEEEKSFLLNSEPKIANMSPGKKLESINISTHNFFKRNVLELEIQENDNIGFVNFSKVIQNPRSLRYSETGRHYRVSTRHQKKQERNSKHLAKFFFPLSEQKGEAFTEENQSGHKLTNCLGATKPYPASFYRIKYQSSHKKYRNKTPEPFMQTPKSRDQKSVNLGRNDSKTRKNNSFRQPQKLFINISKFSN